MSEKALAIVFIKGIVMLIVGIILTMKGVPSDEVEVTKYAGDKIMDAMNKTANSQEVSDITRSTKTSFEILDVGATIITIIGILEIVFSGIALFRR